MPSQRKWMLFWYWTGYVSELALKSGSHSAKTIVGLAGHAELNGIAAAAIVSG